MASGYFGGGRYWQYKSTGDQGFWSRMYYSTTEISGGHRVYVELQIMRNIWSYSGNYGDTRVYTRLNAGAGNVDSDWNNWTFTSGQNGQWIVMKTLTQDIAHTAAQTISLRAQCWEPDGAWCFVTDVTGSITLPALYKAPANPVVSPASATPTNVTMNFSVTSWGTPSSGRWEYYYGTTSTTTDNLTYLPRSGMTTNTMRSDSISGLTPATKYYVRCRTWNGQLNNTGGLGNNSVFSAPPKPTSVTVSNITSTACDVRFNIGTRGSAYKLSYSVDIWDEDDSHIVKNISGDVSASDTSITVHATGLTPDTQYGTVNVTLHKRDEISFNTSTSLSSGFHTKPSSITYCSPSGTAKKAKKMYCGIGYPRAVVTDGTIIGRVISSYSFDEDPNFWDKIGLDKERDIQEIDFISMSGYVDFNVIYVKADGTLGTLSVMSGVAWDDFKTQILQYGFTPASSKPLGRINDLLLISTDRTSRAKKVKKIYCSVGGVAKLMFEDNA